ncbi:MAG: glycosyltransferase [Nitrospinaceae bacterium]|nr:glycosyltransferase family 2 protein [Nitrospinaceae bacterium]NIR53459.1 glycosyltransferase family 2 protein [Nitrospinaceae bacterium]NIS83862.1 glycosyltransferase family 2 protein [Nitrospinaceae bacterium]NIT80653.1 glycosyltransferase family 2 protein [Nitrospinaceae bacterium]NIU42981.1 glycosyltransferase family 2 protein [Nitrospinaceae bacterium]
MPNSNEPVISTVFLNWNRADLLRKSLASYKRTITLPHEIFIMDNASADHSRKIIEEFCAETPSAEAHFLDQNSRSRCPQYRIEQKRWKVSAYQ